MSLIRVSEGLKGKLERIKEREGMKSMDAVIRHLIDMKDINFHYYLSEDNTSSNYTKWANDSTGDTNWTTRESTDK